MSRAMTGGTRSLLSRPGEVGGHETLLNLLFKVSDFGVACMFVELCSELHTSCRKQETINEAARNLSRNFVYRSATAQIHTFESQN